MASDCIDLIDPCTGFQHDIGGVDFVLQRNAFDRTAHQSGGAAADDHDKQILRPGSVHQLQDFSAGTETFLIGQRMPADIDIRVPEHICGFTDLDNRNSAGEIITQNFIHGHRHVVTGLSGTEKINVALFRQIPAFLTDAENTSFHVRDAFDPLIGIKMPEGLFRYVQNNALAFNIAVREQDISVFNLRLHVKTPSF